MYPALPLQRLLRRIEGRGVAVPDGDRGTAFQQTLHHGQANALGTARDHGHLAGEIVLVHGALLRRR
ncbi:hypothetical protein D3C87_2099340 [compost metagenome]